MAENANDGNKSIEPQEPEVNLNPDNDPMLAGLNQAQDSTEGNEEGSTTVDPTEGQEPKPQEGKAPKPEEGKTEGKPEGEDNNGNAPIMIPKPRLDQVLAEKDLLQQKVGYLEGRIDAQSVQAQQQQDQQQAPEGNAEASQVDKIETGISEAESKKLELAEQYDEGEMSLVELRKAEIALDKEIRDLSDQRDEAKRQAVANESKAHTNAVMSAKQRQDYIESQAISIQNEHPNVATIDSLPQATSNAVWDNVNRQAVENLANRGINPNDTSPEVQVAIIQEKAKLTDQLTPENTQALLMGTYQFVDPAQFQPSQAPSDNTAQAEQAKPNQDKANNLANKIDLANSQPPNTADMGKGTNNSELTADQFMSMTQDQKADLYEKAPELVKRALGNKQ